MTNMGTGRRATRLAVIAVIVLAILGVGLAITTRRGRASVEPTVPGHSRPMMQHDWPHPRDFKFAPSAFRATAAAPFKTRSGVRAFVIPSELERVVRVTVAFPLGRLYERPEEAGATDFLAQALTQHSPAGDARPLAVRLESLGLPPGWFQGGLNLMARPFSGEEAAGAAPPEMKQLPDGTSLSLEVLPQDWRAALDLLAALVHQPGIDDAEVRAYRAGDGYSLPLSNPAANSFRPKVDLERSLGGYPLAPPDPGRTLTPAAVRAFASRSLGADQVVFGIGGNVQRADVEAALNDVTKDWRPAPSAPKLASIPHGPAASKPTQLIDAPGISGWVAIGRVLDPVPDADQAALAVMAELLDTRLNITTREIRGLTNRDMFVLPETISGAGLASVRTGARPESIAPLIKLSLEEVARLPRPDDAITDEELERTKGTLVLGRWQVALDGAPQAASTYALEAMRRGGTDWILKWPAAVQAVTVQQVRRVAQKYLPAAQMTTVVVGPIDTIRRARHPRWPVVLDDLASGSRPGSSGGASR